MKPDSRHAVGPTCPYGNMDCSGPRPVAQNNPNTIAACNQETPVISSIFPLSSTTSKHNVSARTGRNNLRLIQNSVDFSVTWHFTLVY